MTTVRLDNGLTSQATKYYIKIYAVSIEDALNKKVIKINIPKAKSVPPAITGWTAGPERISIDLLDIDRKFVIKGKIDLSSNKTNLWADSDLANALLVKERIITMVEKGGVLRLTVGTTDDGYDSTRTYLVAIDQVIFTEVSADTLVASSYDITLEGSVSTDK
jgi:hypothetical protein